MSRMGARVQVVSQVVGDKGPSLTDGPAASTQERKKNGLPSFEKYALLGKGWASSIFGAPLWKQLLQKMYNVHEYEHHDTGKLNLKRNR